MNKSPSDPRPPRTRLEGSLSANLEAHELMAEKVIDGGKCLAVT